jgi:hypothetical protein
MTLADFFLAVSGAGIRLANVGGQLQLRGPASAITPEIRAGAAEHKAALLALLPRAERTDGTAQGVDQDPQSGVAEHGQAMGPIGPDYGLRHDHDWRDWRNEWLLEVGTLYLRMRGCTDEDVLARLRPLAGATPTCLAEWLALGAQIANTEHELRRQGKLPPFPWPDGGKA